MGHVCLLGTAQILKPCNLIGHCHLRFLFYMDFYWLSLFITADTEKPSCKDMMSSKGMQSGLFLPFLWGWRDTMHCCFLKFSK